MSAVSLPKDCSPNQGISIMPAAAQILSISGVAEDHVVLRRILRGRTGRIASARTCCGAFRVLERSDVSIILCDYTLPDGTWRDILRHLDTRIEKPILIVTSRLADEAMWAEVLNLGGFDIIAKPFEPREVQHVLESADLHERQPVRARSAVA